MKVSPEEVTNVINRMEPNLTGRGNIPPELTCQQSIAISAKRQADALERIAAALESQTDIASSIAKMANDIDGRRG